jgi:hypothetical protein
MLTASMTVMRHEHHTVISRAWPKAVPAHRRQEMKWQGELNRRFQSSGHKQDNRITGNCVAFYFP